jgi:hypothetical protein
MTSVVAYLPQYTAAVGGVALTACAVICGLPALISGRSSAIPGWSERRVRAAAALAMLLLGVWGLLFAFVIPGTYPSGVAGGRWGTASTKVAMGIWLLALAAIAGWNVRRELHYLRGLSATGT